MILIKFAGLVFALFGTYALLMPRLTPESRIVAHIFAGVFIAVFLLSAFGFFATHQSPS